MKAIRPFLSGAAAIGLLASGAASAIAAPPPWAPAHGWRAKQHHAYQNWAYEPALNLDLGRCNRDVIGALLGGAGGAAIGSQVGRNGDPVNILLGAAAGALVGGAVGNWMDRTDQACVAQVLEQVPDGRMVSWDGGPEEPYYAVTPRRSYDTGGQTCREYVAVAEIDGRDEQVYGTACREADGSWRIMN